MYPAINIKLIKADDDWKIKNRMTLRREWQIWKTKKKTHEINLKSENDALLLTLETCLALPRDTESRHYLLLLWFP